MKILQFKLTRIGNSKGVRLPADLIKRYGFSGMLDAELREEGVVLKANPSKKLSWEETAEEMAQRNEDWAAWETANADGMPALAWPEGVPSKRPWGADKPRRASNRGKR